MYIYIVTKDDWEDSRIYGVYSSLGNLRKDFPEKTNNDEPPVNGFIFITF